MNKVKIQTVQTTIIYKTVVTSMLGPEIFSVCA